MLDRFIRGQIEKKVFPGLSVLVGERGRILSERCYGWSAVWPEAEPVTQNTLYDLASLTKPLVTAFLAVQQLQKKQWRLEDPLKRFFPALPAAITLEHVLTHSSGLPAWHPFYLYRPLGDLEQIVALKQRAAPGAEVIYSDVGYILLRHLLEKTVGCDFKRLAAEVIFEPLQLQNTFFLVPDPEKPRCAPTEVGNAFERAMCRSEHDAAAAVVRWRRGLLRGEVHDANSFYSGGSAGNAGLFSGLRDLFTLSLEFFPETATLLPADAIGYFWQNRTPWSAVHRSLGFKLNSSRPTSGGRALSKQAIGHNGFTGTSLWLEPETQRQWIILSNRIHPRVKKTDFDVTRRKLHQLLKNELGLS
ncbi:MAG TPA: serine hydrolase domain-containing protein [Candidatus Binatia bacterium]|nr:serine hydrolase domain-containing protein [Candidatus Binatia bacterium]